VIAGPIALDEAPRLCEGLHALLRDSGADVIVCDVRALAADARTVDALARLQLTARRLGCQIRVHRASPELDDLLAFLGLATVVGCCRSQRAGSPRPAAEGSPGPRKPD